MNDIAGVPTIMPVLAVEDIQTAIIFYSQLDFREVFSIPEKSASRFQQTSHLAEGERSSRGSDLVPSFSRRSDLVPSFCSVQGVGPSSKLFLREVVPSSKAFSRRSDLVPSFSRGSDLVPSFFSGRSYRVPRLFGGGPPHTASSCKQLNSSMPSSSGAGRHGRPVKGRAPYPHEFAVTRSISVCRHAVVNTPGARSLLVACRTKETYIAASYRARTRRQVTAATAAAIGAIAV